MSGIINPPTALVSQSITTYGYTIVEENDYTLTTTSNPQAINITTFPRVVNTTRNIVLNITVQ